MTQREYHVSVKGKEGSDGTRMSPFRTISEAANRAQAGDTITVHEGIYRERINPPRGGTSDNQRITYQAMPGEKVIIKGSEEIKKWEKISENIWQTTISNRFFGTFNPFSDVITGDWFNPLNRKHHTGMVYLNDEWLLEVATYEELATKSLAWFASVDENQTIIWANFGESDPTKEQVEINVRQSIFYPDKIGINYLTVRGFTMKHAATPWAPPTAEQIGLLGTHWSKGWVIEDNRISHSRCTGITLGKYGDEWDNVEETAEAYNRTIERALENGWNREEVGHHMVRRNHVSHCEMAGIVGSLGACYSVIEENVIHDIHVIKAFSGAEMAAIKFHGAINTLIQGNFIYHSDEGIWLDWMTQGTRVTRNITYNLLADDLFVEVSHGPYLIDHNLFLSPNSNNVLRNLSQGGTYAHNLFMGTPEIWPQLDRATPYHHEDETSIAGVIHIEGGDDRLYNNLFVDSEKKTGVIDYNDSFYPVQLSGNLYFQGMKPSIYEVDALYLPDIQLVSGIQEEGNLYLEMIYDMDWKEQIERALVTTALLGQTAVSKLSFKEPTGAAIALRTDFFGEKRNEENPAPGPFEWSETGKKRYKIW